MPVLKGMVGRRKSYRTFYFRYHVQYCDSDTKMPFVVLDGFFFKRFMTLTFV